MNFRDYFFNLPKPEQDSLAKRCGVSHGFLILVAYGHKHVSSDIALAIQRETGGMVTVEELRPAFAVALKQAGYYWVRPSTNELLEAA